MSPQMINDTCDGCGATRQLHTIHGNELCDECRLLALSLTTNPQRIARLMHLTGLDTDHASICKKTAPASDGIALPDVLDAVRFRTRDRDLNKWYVSVSEIEGCPVEIFASTAFDRDHHLQSRISNLTTITRLISLILRHVFLGEVLSLEKTIKQIHRSSRQKNDLPDMLTTVLSKYSTASYKDDTSDDT
ncbi:MAG: hypothetical protein ABR512_04800 [Desulfopila sp.]